MEAPRTPNRSGPEPQSQPRDLAGVKILVVDNESDSCAVIKMILEAKHAEARCASSVGKALASFGDFRPHIVVTDIGMPDRDGFDLLRSLRSVHGGEAVPVIALTALARHEDRQRVLRAGFQSYLSKPVHAEELVSVIANLATILRLGAWAPKEETTGPLTPP